MAPWSVPSSAPPTYSNAASETRPYTSLIGLNGSFNLPMKDLTILATNDPDTASMIVEIDAILQKSDVTAEKKESKSDSADVVAKDKIDVAEQSKAALK